MLAWSLAMFPLKTRRNAFRLGCTRGSTAPEQCSAGKLQKARWKLAVGEKYGDRYSYAPPNANERVVWLKLSCATEMLQSGHRRLAAEPICDLHERGKGVRQELNGTKISWSHSHLFADFTGSCPMKSRYRLEAYATLLAVLKSCTTTCTR
jgi:hypothetical protein